MICYEILSHKSVGMLGIIFCWLSLAVYHSFATLGMSLIKISSLSDAISGYHVFTIISTIKVTFVAGLFLAASHFLCCHKLSFRLRSGDCASVLTPSECTHGQCDMMHCLVTPSFYKDTWETRNAWLSSLLDTYFFFTHKWIFPAPPL